MAPNKKDNKKKPSGPKAPIQTDPRFSHVHRDPRFQRPKKQDSKVTVDNRFSSMLKSKEFSSAPKVDKYGRKLNSKSSDQQMKRFYQLQKGEQGSDDEEEEEDSEEDEDEDDVSVSGSEESESDEEQGRDVYDPMRGRGVISGSDSDEESDIDEEAAAELDAEAAAQEDDEDEESEDDVPRGDESHRFACVNLDWDHVKSTDLFKVFSGFKPEKGAIRSVKVYPSEFGKERLEREEREGPPPEIFKKAAKKSDDSDDSEEDEDEITQESMIKNQTEDDGSEEIDSDALRQYQLDRLKYYYAVVDCDSVETAKAICAACDGAEYESSANFFDLRYIPDGMEFDDTPRDESFGAPENYKPNEFTTQVFQHSNVKLTWDEDDADRIKVTRHKFSKQDLEDMDFKAYLASSDEEDSQDEDDIEATRRKYRALLAGGNKDSDDSDADSDDDKNQEMEISFAPGLSEAAAEMLEAKKEREKPVVEETSIDAYKRKEKERKLRRKEARAAKVKANKGSDASDSEGSDVDMGGEALFSDDEDERLMNDSYFAEEFAGGDMMIPGKKGADKKKEGKSKNKKNKLRTKEERLEDNRKKAELELLMEDNRESNQHFNMKEIQKAEKKKNRNKKKGKNNNDKDKGEDLQDDFKIDVKDPRFSALHESHHFALDPTNPNFKKTKAMGELMQERQKRTAEVFEENEKKLKQKQNKNNNKNKDSNSGNKKKPAGVFEDPSLSLLVDTVKRKSAMATENSRDGKRAKKN